MQHIDAYTCTHTCIYMYIVRESERMEIRISADLFGDPSPIRPASLCTASANCSLVLPSYGSKNRLL